MLCNMFNGCNKIIELTEQLIVNVPAEVKVDEQITKKTKELTEQPSVITITEGKLTELVIDKLEEVLTKM